jgi:hypothetical protein
MWCLTDRVQAHTSARLIALEMGIEQVVLRHRSEGALPWHENGRPNRASGKRGTPPPSGVTPPGPSGLGGSVLLEIAPRQHISGRPCHTPAVVLCRPRSGAPVRRALRGLASPASGPRRPPHRPCRYRSRRGVSHACSDVLAQWSNHRRNARNSTAHSTADSSALRRGPRLLFGALRRAGPRPHPHRSGTVRRTPPTQRTSPPGCLPRHGVRCGTHTGSR